MFKIEKVTITSKLPVYPDLSEEDYSEWDPAQCLSTLGVEVLINSTCIFDLGGSGVGIKVSPTGTIGEDAEDDLINAAKLLFELIEENINIMPDMYKKIYEHVLEQFHKEGVVMPSYGRLI